MPLEVEQFMCRDDNFGVLLHNPESGETVAIDAPEAAPILSVLQARNWQLTHILCTHHHQDHVAGNAELMAAFDAELIAPEAERSRIECAGRGVRPEESFELCGTRVEAIDAGGHTKGQLAYHWPEAGRAFTADCLFALGCGRVFEGTMAQMHASLQRIATLPPETLIHCGHEYTLANARFALTIESGNERLLERAHDFEDMRARGQPTLPVTLGDELATNPFLRTGEPAIRAALGMAEAADDVDVFAALRQRKDRA